MFDKRKLLDIFLLAQLILYFAAACFSAGGGNYPGLQSNSFYFSKGIFLALPIMAASIIFILRPQHFIRNTILLIKRNNYLVLYFIMAGFSIVFSDEKSYSLIRYFYTCLGFISLLCVIFQYQQNDALSFRYRVHIKYLTWLLLLLPFYALIQTGFNLTSVRGYIAGLSLIHPNILASLFAHLLIWHYFQYRETKTNSSAFLLILLLFVQILLFSRTAILSLGATSLIISLIMYLKQRSIGAILYLLLSILIGTISAVLITLNVISVDNLLSILIRDDNIRSLLTLTNRTLLWEQLLHNLNLKVFLVGYGYSIIDPAFGIDFGTGILYGAHNTYLSILMGSGIFCLILVLLYLFRNIGLTIAHQNKIRSSNFYLLLSSYTVFIISCFLSEEVGINMSPTFSYLILTTNLLLYSKDWQKQ